MITLVIPVLPLLRYFPGDPLRFWKTLNSIDSLNDFIDKEIKQHKETCDPEITRDLVDAYLHKMKQDKNDQTTFRGMCVRI